MAFVLSIWNIVRRKVAIRFDWLQGGNDSSYIGNEYINGRQVTHWTKQGQYLNHFHSTVDGDLPV